MPSSPAPLRQPLLPFRTAYALGEGLPLPEQFDVTAGGECVELKQGQGVVEGLAGDGAELGAAIGRRLEQSPERLQRLLDLMPRRGRKGHARADRLQQVAQKDEDLAEAHAATAPLLLPLDFLD